MGTDERTAKLRDVEVGLMADGNLFTLSGLAASILI